MKVFFGIVDYKSEVIKFKKIKMTDLIWSSN